MDDKVMVLIFIVLVGAITLISGALNCGQMEQCSQMAEGRGCLPNTVSYDEGECECQTIHGELEWDIRSGSGHD